MIRSQIHALWLRIPRELLQTESSRLLVRDSLGVFVMWGLSLCIRLGLSVVLARTLGATGLGVYSYAVAWLAFLVIPSTLGLDQVSLRYASVYIEQSAWATLRGLLRFGYRTAGAAATLVGIAAIVVFEATNSLEPEAQATMRIHLAIVPIAVLTQVRQASLRASGHTVPAQAIDQVMYPLLLGLLLVAAAFVRGSPVPPSTAASLNATAWIVCFAIGAVFLHLKLPTAARRSTPQYETTDWMRMVPGLVVYGAAYFVLSRGDLLVLGLMSAPAEVGLYSVASRTAEQIVLVVYTVVSLAGPPFFARLYASGNMVELQRLTTLCAKVVFWASLPVYVVGMIGTPWILALFGPEFREATGVMRLLLTTYYISSWTSFVLVMLIMIGRQNDLVPAVLGAAVVNLALSFVLIPPLGMMGAAIACGSSILLLHAVAVWILHRRTGILSLPLTPAPSAATSHTQSLGRSA